MTVAEIEAILQDPEKFFATHLIPSAIAHAFLEELARGLPVFKERRLLRQAKERPTWIAINRAVL